MAHTVFSRAGAWSVSYYEADIGGAKVAARDTAFRGCSIVACKNAVTAVALPAAPMSPSTLGDYRELTSGGASSGNPLTNCKEANLCNLLRDVLLHGNDVLLRLEDNGALTSQ